MPTDTHGKIILNLKLNRIGLTILFIKTKMNEVKLLDN